MSPKAILICGKIAAGKTTYAEKLRIENSAVLLSVDEITLALFGQDAGENHDDYCERTHKYLFKKSLEILEVGVNVILDWGFWQRDERDCAREFYKSRGIKCEFHYIDVSDEVWKENISQRNSAIISGKTTAYYVDEGLAEKFGGLFEMPDRAEIDVWFVNERLTIKSQALKRKKFEKISKNISKKGYSKADTRQVP